jgi:hypothetical protein
MCRVIGDQWKSRGLWNKDTEHVRMPLVRGNTFRAQPANHLAGFRKAGIRPKRHASVPLTKKVGRLGRRGGKVLFTGGHSRVTGLSLERGCRRSLKTDSLAFGLRLS